MALMTWWYNWGMFLFAFLDLLVIVWMIYDSSERRIQAISWRLATITPALLLIPAMMYRFAAPETQVNLANVQEPFFWIGLIGGLVPLIVVVGYVLSYTSLGGQVTAASNVCEVHGQFDPRYDSCPVCAAEARVQQLRMASQVKDVRPSGPDVPVRVSPPPKAERAPKAGALLYLETGHRSGVDYRLNVGNTSIGRSAENDIVVDDDTVSRQHALIREEDGHFTLHDRGSLDGTYVNDQKLRGPVTLQDGDEIGMGNTVFRFKVL